MLWAFLGSLATRYVGHSRAFQKWDGTGSDKLMVTPKDLLVTCVRLAYASLTKYRLIRPVI